MRRSAAAEPNAAGSTAAASIDERQALFVDGLRAGYGGRAVAGLDRLEIARGEAALLIGPSGSGKTTLLLAIAGLAEQMAGTVIVGGTAPASLRRHELDVFRGREIGFVFQSIHLVTGLTLLENVLLAGFASGLKQDVSRARQLLERLGLSAEADKQAQTLSRGQAQRAAIARALLLRPTLVLADEPTASLDDASCEAVTSLLRSSASEEGAALLVATHDQRLREHFPTAVPVGVPA
jgi:putative ABC transport system ATP-binding protein